MRVVKRISLVAMLLIAAALLWFWTPDSDYENTLEKYTSGESQFITLHDETRIHFRDTGERKGPTILMIHGTSDSLLTWEKISPELEKDYRLLSLDLPGHGFSGVQSELTFNDLVSAANQLLQARGVQSATWMGNSLGGGIVWRAALMYPDSVEKIILLDPSGAPRKKPSKSNLGFRILGNPVGRFIGRNITPRALIEQSLRDTVHNQNLISEQLIDQYWELLRLPGNRQALANLATLPRTDKYWQDIGKITQPTLIVWGAEDNLTPAENAPIFEAAIQNAELKIYENVGHLPMLEAPSRLAADIRAFMRAQ